MWTSYREIASNMLVLSILVLHAWYSNIWQVHCVHKVCSFQTSLRSWDLAGYWACNNPYICPWTDYYCTIVANKTHQSDCRIGFPDPKNPRSTFYPVFIGPGKGREKGNICSYLFPKWKNAKGPRDAPSYPTPKMGHWSCHCTDSINQSSDPDD